MSETLINLCQTVFWCILPVLCILATVAIVRLSRVLWIWPRSQLNRIENAQKTAARDIDERFKKLNSRIDGLFFQGARLMAVSQEIKDLTQKIDEATNKVAARIDALKGAIKNSMTDAEVAEVKAGLQAEIDRLTGLGSDPDNPVPPSP